MVYTYMAQYYLIKGLKHFTVTAPFILTHSHIDDANLYPSEAM